MAIHLKLPPIDNFGNVSGERFYVWMEGQIRQEHLHRYAFAAGLCTGEEVLDITCGEGYGSYLMSQVAASVIGVDIDGETIAHAVKKYSFQKNLSFVEGAAQKIPLADKSASRVVSFETIEHFAEQEVFLTEVKRVLKPDGVLIISSPNRGVYRRALSHNKFHEKELSCDEFRGLVSRHFKQHALFSQQHLSSSVIIEQTPAAQDTRVFIDNARGELSEIEEKPNLEYSVILASDVPLPQVSNSVYLDGTLNSEDIITSHPPVHRARLVCDCGQGLETDRALQHPVHVGTQSLKFRLPKSDDVKLVRFYPAQERCSITLGSAKAITASGDSMDLGVGRTNAIVVKGSMFVFASDDPWLDLSVNEGVSLINIDVTYNDFRLSMAEKGVIEKTINNLKLNLDKEKEKTRQIRERLKKNNEKITALKNELNKRILNTAKSEKEIARKKDEEYDHIARSKNKEIIELSLQRANFALKFFRKLGHFMRKIPGVERLQRKIHSFMYVRRISRECRLIEQSGLFDARYYLEHNPDVASARIDPVEHFCLEGWREGRMPNEGFDPLEYLQNRPDVLLEGMNPFVHYIRFGKAESPERVDTVRNRQPMQAEKITGTSASPLRYEEEEIVECENIDTKVMAFYLPQFHPIPENDRWWGKGFTEWMNVTRGKAQYPGHYQPKVPGELGYYDLRLPEIQLRQIELARNHGIHGFCFYYYWFDGVRLLERPLDQFLSSDEHDFPFCICWANENWTRAWDGLNENILIEQVHSDESDDRFIDDVTPFLTDERYVTVEGRPLLIVYRPDLFPEPKRSAERFRKRCVANGLPDPFLALVQTNFGAVDPRKYDYDAAIEFPPHRVDVRSIAKSITGVSPTFTGDIYSYESLVESCTGRKRPSYRWFRGVMPGWDNTARRRGAGYIFDGCAPGMYQHWLSKMIEYTRDALPESERFVFVNAWNEWAEGAYLEPDGRSGYAYLNATGFAVSGVERRFPRSLAVVVHVYYPEMLERILACLKSIPCIFDLFVSTPEEHKDRVSGECRRQFPGLNITVRAVPNIGRDWAPMLIEFSDGLLSYDLALKLHTKKASYDPAYGGWGDYLYRNLAGSTEMVESIFDKFETDRNLGVVYPAYMDSIRDRIEWGSNEQDLRALAERLRVDIPFNQKPDFPAGSMMWFRPSALKPLLSAGLSYEDFSLKPSHWTDGTLAHAVERLPLYVARSEGYRWEVIKPSSERNVRRENLQQIIVDSGLFDPELYERLYRDRLNGEQPLDHYLSEGILRRLQPGGEFNPYAYSFKHADVRESPLGELPYYLLHAPVRGHTIEDAQFGEEYGGRHVHKIAVCAHIYYEEMTGDIVDHLKRIPCSFDLFVSTPESNAAAVRETMARAFPHNNVTVEAVVNRGRNIAPLLVRFAGEFAAYDLVCHVHTKKSPYHAGHLGWGQYLLDKVAGSPEDILEIFSEFDRDELLGLIFPQCYPPLRAYVKEDPWRANWRPARELSRRMGVIIKRRAPLTFPVGVMLWFRPAALKPLLDLRLTWEDFDEGEGGLDGTLAHAIERLFVPIAAQAGYTFREI